MVKLCKLLVFLVIIGDLILPYPNLADKVNILLFCGSLFFF